MQHLAPARVVRVRADIRQDRVTDRLIGLGDQGGTDGAGRIARSEGEHLAPPASRHRWLRQQIAHQVKDVLQVISPPKGGAHIGHDLRAVLIAQAHGAADAGVEMGIGLKRRPADAVTHIGLDQIAALALANVKRRMRPGRGCQVLDRRGNARVALHQQYIGGPQTTAQERQRRDRHRHIGGALLLQIADQGMADRFRDPVHWPSLVGSRCHLSMKGKAPGITMK